MRLFLLQSLLASAAVLAGAADNPSISGKWQVKQSIAGNENEQACNFMQTGSELTGSCGSAAGIVQISGKIDDKKVSWIFKTEYNGSPLTVKYTGTLDSNNKISGTVDVEEYSVQGEFTAVQSK